MGTKLDKTEEQFRELLWRTLAGREDSGDEDFYGVFPLDHRASMLIRALDLEFQEPEGEGVPEEIGWRPVGPMGARALIDGKTGNQIGVVAPDGERTWTALEKALGAYNDFPTLLGLARDLEGELRAGHRCLREPCPTCRLLSRARDLLDRLEEARP